MFQSLALQVDTLAHQRRPSRQSASGETESVSGQSAEHPFNVTRFAWRVFGAVLVLIALFLIVALTVGGPDATFPEVFEKLEAEFSNLRLRFPTADR